MLHWKNNFGVILQKPEWPFLIYIQLSTCTLQWIGQMAIKSLWPHRRWLFPRRHMLKWIPSFEKSVSSSDCILHEIWWEAAKRWRRFLGQTSSSPVWRCLGGGWYCAGWSLSGTYTHKLGRWCWLVELMGWRTSSHSCRQFHYQYQSALWHIAKLVPLWGHTPSPLQSHARSGIGDF